jgi:NAD(P)-dependent dehydrogenase (short-subunit alcohol dehydrogenase family)
MDNSCRAVLVTGCSSGIGRAIALLLAQSGYRVFAGVKHSEQAVELAVLQPTNLFPLLLDVTDTGAIQRASETLAMAAPQGLYALVNNAGVGLASAVEFTSPAELRRLFDVNTIGPLELIQELLPQLRRGHGRIVNISSMNGTMALPLVGGYSATKFALEALSDTLRVELRPWRIPVTLIRPGQVRTPIFVKARTQIQRGAQALPDPLRGTYEELYHRGADFNERGNKSRTAPEDVARVVLRAIEARWPRTHYLVGWDALGMKLAKILPPWLVDRGLAHVMGLHRRAK